MLRKLAQPIKRISYLQIALLLLATMIVSLIHVSPAAAVDDTVYSDATQINLSGDDDYSDAIDLPFNFDFYGDTFDQIYVTTNGVISFNSPSDEYFNTNLEEDNLGNNSIYAFWDDLHTFGLKNIYYKTIGTAGSRKFIVQYTNHMSYSHDDVPFITFQIILYEADDTIQLQYDDIYLGDYGKGKSATIGLSDGTNVDQYSYNEAVLSDRMAIKFTPDGDSAYTIDDEATYEPILLKIVGQPDAPASLTSPTNGATGVSVTPTLSWAAVSGDPDYIVVVSRSSNFKSSGIDVSETSDTNSITLDGENELLPGTTYYWFAKSVASNTGSTHSEVRRFTTVAATVHDISSCTQLQDLDTLGNRGDTYRLTKDIDCSDIENFDPIGNEWDDDFAGIFDGQGHTISDLTISLEDSDVGLFRWSDGATFRNINFSDATIDGLQATGTVVGNASNTNFTNIHVTNIDVSTNGESEAGGIAGFAESDENVSVVTISNVSATGSVDGNYYVGGLIGEVDAYDEQTIVMEKSSFNGDVTASNNYAGGLVGYTYAENDDDGGADTTSITIKNSYAQGSVEGSDAVGGITGTTDTYNDDVDSEVEITLDSVYSTSELTCGSNECGGLTGVIYDLDYDFAKQTYKNSFAVTPVTANMAYALIGGTGWNEGDGDFVTDNNYFDGNAADLAEPWYTDTDDASNISDGSPNPDYFKDNHSSEPMASWDFTNIWSIKTDDYPILIAYEDLNGDGIDDDNQPQVSGYVSPITDKIVVIDAGEGCELTKDDIVEEGDLDAQDAGFDYANGLFGFEAECSENSTTIHLYYYDVNKDDLVARKFNPNTNAFFTISDATIEETTINSHTVTVVSYQITDGGELDMDGEVNGVIADPVGVAESAVGAPNTGLGGLQ